MAKYRALAPLYLGNGVTVAPGEVFESNATPGRNWKPIDEHAKVRAKETGQDPAIQAKEPPAIVIPDNWESLQWMQRVGLAKQIAGEVKPAEGQKKADAADAIIRAELARRKGAEAAPQT